jgi:hypothetical protein
MKADAKAAAQQFVYLATAISALGGMLFGYDIGVISGAVLFIKKDFSIPGHGGNCCQFGPVGIARRRSRRRNPRGPLWAPDAVDGHSVRFWSGRRRGRFGAGHRMADCRSALAGRQASAGIMNQAMAGTATHVTAMSRIVLSLP